MHSHRLNDAQTSFRLPDDLRGRLAAQAQEHGRGLGAELRAAAEISMLVRALYLLRHDPEAKARLGESAASAEKQAYGALRAICHRLFGRSIQAQELLASSAVWKEER